MKIVYFGLVAILLYVILSIQSVSEIKTQTTCVSLPDRKHTVKYDTAVYRRIRIDAPIFADVIPIHFQSTSPSELFVEKKFRKAYTPWREGELEDKFINWRPLNGVADLLFVDMTDGKSKVEAGYRYFDVYLKPNKEGKYIIPDFIRQYCAMNYPSSKKNLLPDENGAYFPPITIDPASIQWTNPTPGVPFLTPVPLDEYFIFSYVASSSATGLLSTNTENMTGTLTVSQSGKTKTYKVYYLTDTVNTIGLVDMDTKSPDAKILYKYTYARTGFQPTTPQADVTNTEKPKTVQLETFTVNDVNTAGWWSPECKPAIYLYPEKATTVHVTVKPQGYLTYTDPPYPSTGWEFTAYPDGTLIANGKKYPYLYYESKIRDDALIIPQKGYVVPFKDLSNLYSKILPQMGLNATEVKDFKDYWEKVLPYANYYFVGIMEKEAIEKIEPLTISPKHDTIIRVRVYFQALNEWKKVEAPILTAPQRKGFVVSEWGGLVKVDKEHPFTCSQ